MLRKILAVFAGAVASVLIVAVIQAIGHAVDPPPADLDFEDPAKVKEFISGLPVSAFLFVLASWIFGAFGGGYLAARIAGARPYLYAFSIAVIILVGTIMTLVSIPHPVWFSVSAVLLVPLGGWAAGRLSAMRSPAGARDA